MLRLLSRRRFLKIALLSVGVAVISGCAITTTAVRPSFRTVDDGEPVRESFQSKTEKESQTTCVAIVRGKSKVRWGDGTVSDRHVEGDPDSPLFIGTTERKPVLDEAVKYLGTRYRSGGTGPNGFDCSGFVWRSYSDAGIALIRASSADYFQKFSKIDRDVAQPGDLVFFREHGRINHVGIFLGGDRFIHSSTAIGVTESSLSDNYWRPRLAGFRRVES